LNDKKPGTLKGEFKEKDHIKVDVEKEEFVFQTNGHHKK